MKDGIVLTIGGMGDNAKVHLTRMGLSGSFSEKENDGYELSRQ